MSGEEVGEPLASVEAAHHHHLMPVLAENHILTMQPLASHFTD